MADILKVAEQAGVSKSTVSRVLNNGRVAPETRERVEQVMRELNYRPSSFAQNIRTRRSKEVAVMIPDLSNSFFAEMFRAIEDVMIRNSYMVVLCDTRQSTANEIRYAERLISRHIDGLLYFTQQKEKKNCSYFTALSGSLPMIFMDYAFAETEGIDCIAMESRTITEEAVKALYRKGKRHIAYINLPKAHNVTMVRCEGYKDGLRACGLPVIDERIVNPRGGTDRSIVDTGHDAARQLLEQCGSVDAVMTASDQLAVGVVSYLNRTGIRIPQEIAVMGFDDIDLCQTVSPMLSTIRQPIREMGHAAAERLLERIRTGEPPGKKLLFRGELVLRESTGS